MIAVKNGKIVTPTGVIENKILWLEDGLISAISDDAGNTGDTGNTGDAGNVRNTGDAWNAAEAGEIIDARGRYVTPGFIDIHSDRIEQFIQPRPTSQMDFELALKECERELLHLGITTMYHSLALFKDEFFGKTPLRTKENVARLSELIRGIHDRNHLIRHRIHLRIEIDNLEAYDIVKSMMERNLVHQISFMDHTPGQGQYRSLEIYEKTISKYQGKEISSVGIEEIYHYHREKEILSFRQLKELTDMAHEKGIPVASHDDDTVAKLEVNRELGLDISEFPIMLETARAARNMGFFTVVGAPNILLGGSHSGNMSAAEAIREDCADILCSDYYPPAILHGVFSMHDRYAVPLHEMVNRATLNPARAMRIEDRYGSIEVGKRADLLIIDVLDGYPVITHVLVDGKPTARVEYRK
jgi:alpha-D-ribose 1-methylphosphonate 5-triphosphate diphosphatase